MQSKADAGIARSNHYGQRVKGFTLLEVLIATIILFLFLTLAAQAFSQSALSSRKAERAAKVSAAVPLLVETIRGKIAESTELGNKSGDDQLFDLSYHWQAKLLQRARPPERFDPDALEIKEYDEKFNLWQVALTVSIGTYSRTWQYEELSWSE